MGTHDDRWEHAVARREANSRTEEGRDGERDGRDGVDGGGLHERLDDAPLHGLALSALRSRAPRALPASSGALRTQDPFHDEGCQVPN